MDPRDLADFSFFRWEESENRVKPVRHVRVVPLEDLLGVERAKQTLVRNTATLVEGGMANNALLWGARGCGKSSLVKATAAHFAPRGLKLVEIRKEELFHLPRLSARLRASPWSFILYCDDLSFERGDASFKPLKALLEGGVESQPENVVLYATSNRRHLMPRHFAHPDGGEEIHPAEEDEERISLSDRFGLWLGFHPFDQEEYLAIVRRHVERLQLPVNDETLRREALDWARVRGSRSGRAAWQFVVDWAGRSRLPEPV